MAPSAYFEQLSRFRYAEASHRQTIRGGKRYHKRIMKGKRSSVQTALLQAPAPTKAQWKELRCLLEVLQDVHRKMHEDPDLDDKSPTDWTTTFRDLRRDFMMKYESLLARSGLMDITAAPVATSVQDKFMATYMEYGPEALVLAYHGTSAHLHRSIFSRGLLVPGGGSGVVIRNGNAHGKGIYVANENALFLSKSFLRDGARMLICGVIDNTKVHHAGQVAENVQKKKPRQQALFRSGVFAHRRTRRPVKVGTSTSARPPTKYMGRFPVYAESEEVRHVGGAMVIRNSGHVCPLFTADCETSTTSMLQSLVSGPTLYPNLNRRKDPLVDSMLGRRRVFNPYANMDEEEEDTEMWLFGEECRCSHAMYVKRRLNKRRWQADRRFDRAFKYEIVS